MIIIEIHYKSRMRILIDNGDKLHIPIILTYGCKSLWFYKILISLLYSQTILTWYFQTVHRTCSARGLGWVQAPAAARSTPAQRHVLLHVKWLRGRLLATAPHTKDSPPCTLHFQTSKFIVVTKTKKKDMLTQANKYLCFFT